MISVLIVDDEPFNLDLLEFAFEGLPDVEVVRASNGFEALEVLRSRNIDVILLDIKMPVMDGYQLLKTIRSDKDFKNIPVIIITSSADEKKTAFKLGANDFLFKPFDPEEVKLRTLNYAEIKKYNDLLKNMNAILERRVRERTRALRDALKTAKEAEREIALRLGRVAEFRDIETGSHIVRMSKYCAKLAELAGLSREGIELILYASPLHDVGKVGVPDKILRKPGKLTFEEFEIMKRHTIIGGQILSGSDSYPTLRAGRIIALQHHERLDGKGYPNGLKGSQIHIYGRITAIADVFDALTTKRVYKPAYSVEQSLDIMLKERGKHFDPDLLDLFIDNIEEFLRIKDEFKEV